MVGIDPWMKKAVVVQYNRISSGKQAEADKGKPPHKKETLLAQGRRAQAGLKHLDMQKAKAVNTFYEVASGGDEKSLHRPVWLEARHRALELAAQGKRVVMVVTEPARWSRNQDFAVLGWYELKRAGIPVLEITEGLQTGTYANPRPTENAMMMMKMSMVELERATGQAKATQRAADLRSQGIKPASMGTLWPFAKVDPFTVLLSVYERISLPKAQGGGRDATGRYVIAQSGKDGPASPSWVSKPVKVIIEAKAKLTPEEFDEWVEWRTNIRDLYKEKGHDPAAKVKRPGKVDWGVRAVNRYVQGYLAEPWSDDYRAPSLPEIEEYLSDPLDYLSDSDRLRYRQKVGKRRKMPKARA